MAEERAAALWTSFVVGLMVIHAFNCCCEDPRPNDRGGISPVCSCRGGGRQRLSPMAGPLCAALSVSTRGGSIPRACHSRAVDLLRPRGLSGASRARACRDLGDAPDPARRHLCHSVTDSLRSALQLTSRRRA